MNILNKVFLCLMFIHFVSCKQETAQHNNLNKNTSESEAILEKNFIPLDKDALNICVFEWLMPLSQSKPDSITKKQGIYVDLANFLGEKLKKRVNLHYIRDYYFERPIRKGISEGNCDIQFGIPDPNRKFIRRNKILTGLHYIDLSYVLVLPKGIPIKSFSEMKGKNVALLKGSPPTTPLLLTESKITPVFETDDALKLLSEKKVDAAYVWGPRAGYLNKEVYHNLFNIYDTPYKWSVVMGISVDQEQEMKVINALENEIKTFIQKKKQEYGFDYKKSIYIPENILY